MRRSYQSGSALVVAIFVIVVLGLLVATLSRLTISSSDAVITEVLGARAQNAAQTGLNIAMMEVFPLNEPNYDAIADCSDFNVTSPVTFPAATDPGLAQCAVTIECRCISRDDGVCIKNLNLRGPTYFEITATGDCSAGPSSASRTLSVEVTGQ